MNIIILGGSGFVGMNLKNTIDNKHKVLDFSRSQGHNIMDYTKSVATFAEFEPDVIFNLACHGGSLHYVTEFAADVINDNITIALNLYRIIKELPGSPKIINAISNCSYPGGTQIQEEPNWLSGPVHDSVFSFANSKRVLYYISKCYHMQYGIKSINLIFSNAFGINDHIDPNKTHAMDGMIIRMLKAKQAGDLEFEVWGTGKPIREWIYVEDFCKILMLGAHCGPIIEPINVAQGRGYSIKESIEIIKEMSGYNGDIIFNTDYQDGDPVKILGDKKFKSFFNGYKFIDHGEAIRRTIEYYKEIL